MSSARPPEASRLAAWEPLRTWWGRLADRERQLLVVMLALLLAATLWFAAIAPAWRTLRTAPAQIETLEGQWQSMQQLAEQARGLQGRPALGRDESLRELEASVRQRLGASAQVSAVGDRVTVVLKGAPPQSMAAWLSQARLQARVVAIQANLTRTAAGWDGTLVFNLPPAP